MENVKQIAGANLSLDSWRGRLTRGVIGALGTLVALDIGTWTEFQTVVLESPKVVLGVAVILLGAISTTGSGK